MKFNRRQMLLSLAVFGIFSSLFFQNFTNYESKGLPGCEAGLHSGSGKTIYRCFNRSYTSIIYGQPDQQYDLYLPPQFELNSSKKYPMVVNIHGDHWRGDKGEEAAFAESIAAMGYVVANLNYTTSGAVWNDKRNATLDIQEYMRSIFNQKATESQIIDPLQILLTGFGSGGHLALMEATRGEFNYFAVLVKSAPTRIDKLLDSPDPAFKSTLVDVFGGAYSFREKMSPYNRIEKLKTRILFMEHSQTDTFVPFTQATDFFTEAKVIEKIDNFVAGDPISVHQEGYIIGNHNFSEGSLIKETLEVIYNKNFNPGFFKGVALSR